MAQIELIPNAVSARPDRFKFAPPVRAARLRHRHIAAMLSFAVMVLLPALVAGWYLWTKAANQFASTVAFSVRSEDTASGIELLGGIADLSGSGANDSDILYDFLRSQQLVAAAQSSIDISAMWARPDGDPVFAYDSSGTIEDLHEHWLKMVDISHDTSRGIIEITARAFSANDAQSINAFLLEEATKLVNQINDVARDDAIQYALKDLQRSQTQLTQARQALTEFRVLNEIVDPEIEARAQIDLINSLETHLTETLIEVEILSANTRRDDTRIRQAKQRAHVLRERIETERSNRLFGTATGTSSGLAQLYSEFERLRIDVEFAEQGHQAARANFERAISDARRKTRYLAAHVLPTLAEQSLFPHRGMIFGLIVLFTFLIWGVTALVGFSFLDRT